MPDIPGITNKSDERAKIWYDSHEFIDKTEKNRNTFARILQGRTRAYSCSVAGQYHLIPHMEPVKVNIFISFAWEDQEHLHTLLRWLYPMRDEVNLWFNDPPPPARSLSLPWQLLLFWYRRPNPQLEYSHILQEQLQRAHVYLFLTSYSAVSDPSVEFEITTAVQRYIDQGDKYIRVFPLILSPSQWKQHSRLARFKPIGKPKPISDMKVPEEGWLAIADEIKLTVLQLQRNLNELRQFKALEAGGGQLPATDTGDDDAVVEYEAPISFDPPEWLGWAIIAGLVMLTMARLGPELPTRASKRYQNVPPPESKPLEYIRENPLAPVPDSVTFKQEIPNVKK